MMEATSGRAIWMRQENERKQVFIDCSLAMAPGYEAAFREAAKDLPDILKALDDFETKKDRPAQS